MKGRLEGCLLGTCMAKITEEGAAATEGPDKM